MPHVIVVGSGIAGLVAALTASESHSVTLVSKADLAESNTFYAQGGIAAALSDDDSVAEHVADTVSAGAGLNDLSAVEVLCAEGPDRIRDLIRAGVPFDTLNGMLARGLEAAHSHPRVLHAGGDATGAAIEFTLVRQVRASSIRVLEHTFMTDLVVNDGDVVGIEVIDELGAHSTLYADAVILASGGAGQLFRHTTNPLVTTGDGVAAAWRAGAQLADLEFYQFHPTTLAGSGNFLVSEAVRGEGAVLRNRAGVRFMLDVHPDGELAPRDVVARAIAVEMAAQDGEAVTLDATELGREFLSRRFPTIDAACTRVGLDWATVQVPVTPAAHYWMGGIATDINGRTSLPRLYAVGEAACTGAHGANRLASNSLLESLVFGHRASRDLDRFSSDSWSTSVVEDSADPAVNVAFADAPDGVTVDRATLQNLMWECAGVHRSETTLGSAARSLNGLRAERGPGASVGEREDANLLDLGRLIVAAALSREESRGAHFRSDFPMVSAAAPFHHAWSRKVSVPC